MREAQAPAFEDVALPGFDIPAPVVRTRSKKQEADDLRIIYTRHAASPRANCHHCLQELVAEERKGVNPASYQRSSPEGLMLLCGRHTQEQRHRDSLAGLLSGSAK